MFKVGEIVKLKDNLEDVYRQLAISIDDIDSAKRYIYKKINQKDRLMIRRVTGDIVQCYKLNSNLIINLYDYEICYTKRIKYKQYLY